MSSLFIKSTLSMAFLLAYFLCNGQIKNEREYRISMGSFPEKAIQEMEGFLEPAKRVRYFQEFDTEKMGFEIKFNLEGRKHSIEFDSLGNLIDIETHIKKREMPSNTSKVIEQYLDSEFTRYRIIKIQRQYPKTAFEDGQSLFEIAFYGKTNNKINYEIVVAGRKKKGFSDYEMTFDTKGDLLNVREFISFDYDHILY